MGKTGGIEGMEGVHREANIKMLKMDKDNEEYTLWADPTIIELGDKDYAENLYTGQKWDCPILVGLKEMPIFVNHKYRHTACDSEFYNAEVINSLQSKKGSTFK